MLHRPRDHREQLPGRLRPGRQEGRWGDQAGWVVLQSSDFRPLRKLFADTSTLHCDVAFVAQDKYLAQALWELSERIIKDKVGQDALTSWDR